MDHVQILLIYTLEGEILKLNQDLTKLSIQHSEEMEAIGNVVKTLVKRIEKLEKEQIQKSEQKLQKTWTCEDCKSVWPDHIPDEE